MLVGRSRKGKKFRLVQGATQRGADVQTEHCPLLW